MPDAEALKDPMTSSRAVGHSLNSLEEQLPYRDAESTWHPSGHVHQLQEGILDWRGGPWREWDREW